VDNDVHIDAADDNDSRCHFLSHQVPVVIPNTLTDSLATLKVPGSAALSRLRESPFDAPFWLMLSHLKEERDLF
jgi:hypothetical protein